MSIYLVSRDHLLNIFNLQLKYGETLIFRVCSSDRRRSVLWSVANLSEGPPWSPPKLTSTPEGLPPAEGSDPQWRVSIVQWFVLRISGMKKEIDSSKHPSTFEVSFRSLAWSWASTWVWETSIFEPCLPSWTMGRTLPLAHCEICGRVQHIDWSTFI